MNLFGKKAKPKPAPPNMANEIVGLREALNNLEKREGHLQKKVQAAILEAKQKMGNKDKKGALYALKRKKMYEAQVTQINGSRITLEQQIIALEGASINRQTVDALKRGVEAQKAGRGNLDVDVVDELMDDIQEELVIADEIGQAIARPAEDLFDDEELLEELNMMEEKDLEEQLLSNQGIATPAEGAKIIAPDLPAVPTNPVMPAVPTGAVKVSAGAAEDDDLAALRELEASMAL